MNTVIKSCLLLLSFLFLSVAGYSQDPNVKISPRYNQSASELQQDKNQCYSYAESQFDHTKHKTLKNTGAGAGIGAVAGKIFGKPGIGAAAGGAAGAYRGHKKNKQDEKEFDNVYASCLREKGYAVSVEED